MIVQQSLSRAKTAFNEGDFKAAEHILRQGLTASPDSVELLNGLAAVYEVTENNSELLLVCKRLCTLVPEVTQHWQAWLAVAHRSGDNVEITEAYRSWVARNPNDAVSLFNLGWYSSRAGQHDVALNAYKNAVDVGLENPAEAHTNIALIYSVLDHDDEVRTNLMRAIELDSSWIPAWYNLGLWYEEHGNADQARQHFQRVLDLDPNHAFALCRLAELPTAASESEHLQTQIQRLLSSNLATAVRVELLYALAKLLDHERCYERAYKCLKEANCLSDHVNKPYRPDVESSASRRLMENKDKERLYRAKLVSDRDLILICGMFRSGTTLLESILSGSERIMAGGEIGFVAPDQTGCIRADVMSNPELTSGLLERYAARLPSTKGRRCWVTDKRPDNAFYAGIILASFPNAKVIYMVRNAAETCLSLYSQSFDPNISYARSIEAACHHLELTHNVMMHWRSMFADRIKQVRYEDLVHSPDATLRDICAFLDISCESRMLDFTNRTGRVQTASLWQIREPLHSRSINRSAHFNKELNPFQLQFRRLDALRGL